MGECSTKIWLEVVVARLITSDHRSLNLPAADRFARMSPKLPRQDSLYFELPTLRLCHPTRV